jgi:hypothetical protein
LEFMGGLSHKVANCNGFISYGTWETKAIPATASRRTTDGPAPRQWSMCRPGYSTSARLFG